MWNKNILKTLLFAVILGSCSNTAEPRNNASLSNETFLSMGEEIKLQHLKTRIIIICRDSKHASAETCATYFEERNYVRLRDIPYKVAKYDRLTKETFPTRRWRNGERTPRW